MGKTGVHAWLMDALGDTGPVHQDHITADLQMIQRSGLAARHNPVSYFGRSSHDKTGGEQAVPADFDVVGNVTEVVELGAGADPGRGVGCSINATNPILDHHPTELRNAMAAPLFVLGKSIAFGTHHSPGLDDHLVADLAAWDG